MLQVLPKNLCVLHEKRVITTQGWGGGKKGPNEGQQGCRWMSAGVWGERDIDETDQRNLQEDWYSVMLGDCPSLLQLRQWEWEGEKEGRKKERVSLCLPAIHTEFFTVI